MVNTKPGLSPGPLRWRINKRLCNKRKGGMDLDLSQFRMILNCIFFIEVSNKQQARKLQATGHKILVDSYFIIRYSRINGEVEHRKICSLEPYNKLGISTTKCSSMRAPRKYPGLPVDSNVIMVMERPGDMDYFFILNISYKQQATSYKLQALEIRAASIKRQAASII